MDGPHDPYDLAACIESAALRGASLDEIHAFTDMLELELGRDKDGSLRPAVEKSVAEYRNGNEMRGSLILATILALFVPEPNPHKQTP